jgi:hypothetical protein
MNKYWFRPKRYGYGMEPSSWEGWVATLVFTGLILLNAYLNGLFSTPDEQLASGDIMSVNTIVRFLIILVILIVLFIKFSASRCKGKMKWNWGKKDQELNELEKNYGKEYDSKIDKNSNR